MRNSFRSTGRCLLPYVLQSFYSIFWIDHLWVSFKMLLRLSLQKTRQAELDPFGYPTGRYVTVNDNITLTAQVLLTLLQVTELNGVSWAMFYLSFCFAVAHSINTSHLKLIIVPPSPFNFPNLFKCSFVQASQQSWKSGKSLKFEIAFFRTGFLEKCRIF